MRLLEVIQKFRLHPSLDPSNYVITPSLRNVAKWNAIILDGSSTSADQEVGDWDEVGYVMISLKDDTIIPIARGDEHHKGMDMLYDIKGVSPHEYYPIFHGGEYIDEYNMDKLLIAAKKWRKYGGPNILLEAGYSVKSNTLTMDQFIKAGGVVNVAEGQLAPLGQNIIDGLKTVAAAFSKTRDNEFDKAAMNTAIRETKKFLDLILTRPVIMSMNIDYEAVRKLKSELRLYKENIGELESHIFGFGKGSLGVKNMLHQQIRKVLEDPSTLWADRTIAVMGDLKIANAMFSSL